MKMRHHIALIVLVCATLLSSHPALAQFSQQGPKLVGTGAVGNAQQGISASLSADGNTAIIGGSGDNSLTGAAWVWTRSGGVWTQQGLKLVDTVEQVQGISVSLSADGNTAIIGGLIDNGVPTGAASVWTRSGGVWTQQGKLVGLDAVGNAQQGRTVSLSADGNTAIVGGDHDNGSAGAAWVWTRSGGVWTQQGSKLVGSGAAGSAAAQGYSVSLSADGNTALVGGWNDNGQAGAVWVWTRSGGVWTQQGTKLVGSGAVGNAFQGYSVSLSADGTTAIVGGYADNSNAGAAWVWTRSGGVWTQQDKLVGSPGTGNQGYSVSLRADGNTAIVGGPSDNGGAWVWTRSGGVWTQQVSKLVGSGAVGAPDQGKSVSLSADGTTAIVGGDLDNSGVGAAWVFAASAPCTPSVTATVSGAATVCPGQPTPIQAVLTGTGPWNVTWSDSVVQSGVATSPVTRSVSPSSTTTYTVTALTDANCAAQAGDLTGSAVVTVNPAPTTPNITAPASALPGATGLIASVPAHAGSTYSWTIGNGAITSGQGTNQITFTAVAAGTPLTLSVTETNALGCVSVAGTATVTVLPAGSAGLFYTVDPCRQLDTRSGSPITPGGTLAVALTGTPCGIPSGATSVSVNAAVTQETGSGHLTIYPADKTQPLVSNINFNAGQTRANNAVLSLSSDGTGRVNVVNGSGGTTHVIIDVNGYFQ
jgi:hypothetical protein